MKKYIVSAVIAFGILAFPALSQAQPVGFSSSQINAVISLLQAFGVDQATINNVEAALGATTNHPTPCPAWGCNGPKPIQNPRTTTTSQITSPTTGTQWAIGTTQNITWTPPQGAVGAVITIQNNVSTAGCQTSLCVYNSGHESYLLTPNGFPLTPNNGSFAWKVGTGIILDDGSGNSASVPTGTYQVNITFEDASGNEILGQTQLNSGWFTITSGTVSTQTPTVTGVTSAGATPTPGTAAFVLGSNFDQNSIIVIDGTQVPTTYISSQSLQFIVPSTESIGSHTASVTEKAGPNSNTITFIVTSSATTQAPSITLFGAKDPNPTTGAVYISWQTSVAANVALSMSCKPGSISFTTDKGNSPTCDKGGVWNWWNGVNNDSILVTPSGNTSAVTVPFTLTVLNQNGTPSTAANQTQTINVTFPAQVTTTPQQVPTITFIGTPTLTLQYDSAGKEANLVGTANVQVTAGNAPLNINGLPYISYLYKVGSGYTSSNSTHFSAVGYPIGTIPANTTGKYTLTVTAPARELFAGAYTLAANAFSYTDANNNYQTIQTSFPGIVPAVTIVGELSPYISSITNNADGSATIQGVRLGSSGGASVRVNVIGGNSSGGFSTNSSGTTITFRPADFGITSSGTLYVQVMNSLFGNSNGSMFIYTAPTPPVVTPTSAAASCSNPAPACQSSQSACTSQGTCSSGSCSTAESCLRPQSFGGCGGTWTSGCNGTWIPAQPASVWNAVNGLTSSASNNSAPQASISYVWNHDLQIGSLYYNDVVALQTALTKEGTYTGEITGGFYNGTFAAVKAFQQKYGIDATGFVGPDTRAKLNALY